MRRQRLKPSRTMSRFGFFIGIGFCLFGLFSLFGSVSVTGSVIPVPFFLVWVGVAGFITYTHFKNGFTEEGVAYYEIEQEEDEEALQQTAPKPLDFEEKLRKLEALKRDYLISEAEYREKREEIMSQRW